MIKSFRTASPVSRKESAIKTGGNLVESRRKTVTPEQVKAAQDVLAVFGLDKVYSDESLPLTRGNVSLK